MYDTASLTRSGVVKQTVMLLTKCVLKLFIYVYKIIHIQKPTDSGGYYKYFSNHPMSKEKKKWCLKVESFILIGCKTPKEMSIYQK